MLRWLRQKIGSRAREEAEFFERLRRLVDSRYTDEALISAVPQVEPAAPQRDADVQAFDYDDWVAHRRSLRGAAKPEDGPS